MLIRLIIGILSIALGAFAVKEIIEATDITIYIIAFMILIMALAGVVESLKSHHKN